MIIVPYTRLHPATARLLNKHAPGHRRVKLDPADMSAYWRLLAACWREPGELLVIEQDIGVRAGVVEELAACPEPWCGFGYPIDGSTAVCLGCTRFAAALKAAEPDLLEEVGEDASAGLPARDWRRLDVRILDALRKRGYQQHRHHPNVLHYHRYAAR
jgi:hypothetical protein